MPFIKVSLALLILVAFSGCSSTPKKAVKAAAISAVPVTAAASSKNKGRSKATDSKVAPRR